MPESECSGDSAQLEPSEQTLSGTWVERLVLQAKESLNSQRSLKIESLTSQCVCILKEDGQQS